MVRMVVGLAALCMMAGCQPRPGDAIGGDDQIIVFADSSAWTACLPSLQRAFERTFPTPQPEKEFYIQLVPLQVFEIYKKYKNIVFLGTLESTGPVSQTVQGMLASDVREGVQSGRYFLFTRDDEWAHHQKVMILAAADQSSLSSTIWENADPLFSVFDEHKTRLGYDVLFGRDNPLEDRKLRADLHLKYGWTMRLHPDYKLVFENSDLGYVRFHARSRHAALQRWISVFWQHTTTPDTLMNSEAMVRLRNRIGEWFVDPTVTVPEYDQFGESAIAGYTAHVYRGVWKTTTSENAFGGAFRAYAFFDSSQSRAYFIDQAVFYPEEKKKLQFLRELDIITNSFSIQFPR